MKHVWVNIVPWDKELAVAALESGADGVVLEAGVSEEMHKLGRMTIIGPDGDIQPDRDFLEMAINSKEDEQRAAWLDCGLRSSRVRAGRGSSRSTRLSRCVLKTFSPRC